MNNKTNKIITFSLLLIVILLTIGWSAFQTKLKIGDIKLEVREKADIRVTGVIANNNQNNGISNWEDYNITNFSSGLTLPAPDSTVTYRIEVTNFESPEMGIYNITGLPDNLEYTIDENIPENDKYHLKDKICDQEKCNLGAKKYIYITLKYKDNGYQANNTTYAVQLDFDFRGYHNISYVNINRENNPLEIMDGDNLIATFNEQKPLHTFAVQNKRAVNSIYDSNKLTVSNVKSNLRIFKSNYKWDYLGVLETIEDLVDLSNEVNEGQSYKGKSFLLVNNLDFADPNSYANSQSKKYGDLNDQNGSEELLTELTTGTGFNPIGQTSSTQFEGNFDGNGKTISNIHIYNKNYDGTRDYGFFGYLKNGKIVDFTTAGNLETAIKANIGGLAGRSTNEEIDNCHNKATIKSNADGYSVSGLIGSVYGNVKITNSSNSAAISNSNNLGGIVGYVGDNVTLTIENSHNTGDITNLLGTNVGGLIGRDNSNSSTINIINSYNEGTIIADNKSTNTTDVGGLIGTVHGNLNIKNNSYNSAPLTLNSSVNKSIRIGGLVGYTEKGNINISNSYNDNLITINSTASDATNNTFSGGIIGQSKNNASIVLESVHNNGEINSKHNGSGNLCLGGLVGLSYYNTKLTINNSYNNGQLNPTRFNSGLIQGGGLIGDNDSTILTITNSSNKKSLTCISPFTKTIECGGIIGTTLNSTQITIDSSFNDGLIKGTNESGTTRLGGFTGYINNSNLNIKNFQNKQNISSQGVDGGTYVGGVIGFGSKTTYQFDNILNEATELKSELTAELPTHDETIGGIIGYIENNTNVSTIQNSQNKANINNGSKAGGIIGYTKSATTIINKTHNIGNITQKETRSNSVVAIGGLISYNAYGSVSYILNSYNTGNLSYTGQDDIRIGGLIGSVNSNNTEGLGQGYGVSHSYFINSYNMGKVINLSGKQYTSGIFNENNGTDNLVNIIKLNNVYSTSDVEGQNQLGIGFIKIGDVNATNTYFKNTIPNASNKEINATGMSESAMKDQSFIDLLNNNISQIKLSDISPLLKDYTLITWHQGTDGYPTFTE